VGPITFLRIANIMSRRAASASASAASQSPARKDDAGEGTGSSAKYIQGNISMVRSKKLLIPSLRNGVMVINIADGGSLSFYKDWGNSWNAKRKGSSSSIANGSGSVISGLNGDNDMKRVSSTSSLLELCDSTNQSITINTDEKQSIFLRQSKSRRNVMQVDEETKAKIEKVSIYVSRSEFREPIEMPYLKIPAVSLMNLPCLLIVMAILHVHLVCFGCQSVV
jgi:hypothetical protein